MGKIPKGSLVTIVSNDKVARPYYGRDAMVVGELTKRHNEPLPSYPIRDIETGRLLFAQPGAIAGPLMRGYAYSLGNWDECVWRPRALRT